MPRGAARPAIGSGRALALLLLGLGSTLALVGLTPDRSGASITPCSNGIPAGKVIYQGEFTQTPAPFSLGALRERGVRLLPIRPASALDGEQELPVRAVSWKGRKTTIRLAGGLRLERGERALALTRMRVILEPNRPRVVVGRIGTRELRLFSLNRTKVRKRKGRISEVELTGGVARLTGPAARLMRGRLGLERLRRGAVWSFPDLFVRGAGGGDLIGDLPAEAPPVVQPEGAVPIEAGTIRWRMRESFVNYLSSGGFVDAVEPASPGPAESFEGGPELVYDFRIPFASGWVAPGGEGSRTLVEGVGGVWFRLCRNTINFTLTDPEILLDGDSSQLVVRAEGTDGTPYDGRRILVLRLFPSRAKSAGTEGRQTVLEGVPAYVAQGATGVFLSYPAFPGSFENPAVELSRFGSISVSYTRAANG